jgi:hypothetical protein
MEEGRQAGREIYKGQRGESLGERHSGEESNIINSLKKL